MKVGLAGLACCLLSVMGPARAATEQAGGSAAQQKQVEQAITQQQAQVHQLQGDVAREESRTHQADAKLKEQDQAIAELQRQLDALKAPSKGSGHP
ncbi:hypothetical protein [Dyella sp. C9]|uniref:hypothetical protein n=1 Tax=Dyella sp. C9 TaxID=2202154 RepID=UPI000DEF5C9E|nr:hypothetical protein [Dyella sp. C9]